MHCVVYVSPCVSHTHFPIQAAYTVTQSLNQILTSFLCLCFFKMLSILHIWRLLTAACKMIRINNFATLTETELNHSRVNCTLLARWPLCVCVCFCVCALGLGWVLLSHCRPDMVIYCNSRTSQILSYQSIKTSAAGSLCMPYHIILISNSHILYACIGFHMLYVHIHVGYVKQVSSHTPTHTQAACYLCNRAWTSFIFTLKRSCYPPVEH